MMRSALLLVLSVGSAVAAAASPRAGVGPAVAADRATEASRAGELFAVYRRPSSTLALPARIEPGPEAFRFDGGRLLGFMPVSQPCINVRRLPRN